MIESHTAFLLLTFFILTTTLTKPFVLQMDMPEEPKDERDQFFSKRHFSTAPRKEQANKKDDGVVKTLRRILLQKSG